MKAITLLLALALLVSPVPAQTKSRRPQSTTPETPVAQTAKPNLPIRRVILYSNGVAYFERRGQVNGNAEVNLPFKQSQVDDVLKSLVVLDLGKGRIGAVSYNSSAPPAARLAENPFSIEAGTRTNGKEEDGEAESASGLAGVLSQLQGAHVLVTTATRSVSGAIITVEERESRIDADKPPVVTQSLILASESGDISKFNLDEIRSVKLLDEGARHDIKEFADTSASARRRDAKTISVTSDGAGARDLLVSYTVAAPIWKTTYRVVLDSDGKPFFQGWAIVDNISDEDWTEVSLSLFSGSPVSFIQPIQQPLYRYRPVIPLSEDLQLTPQVYDTGVGEGRGVGSGYGPREGGVAGGVAGGVPGGVVGGVPGGRVAGISAGEVPPLKPEPKTALSDLMTSEDSSIQTAATGKAVGDLFEYRIDQLVTVRRNRSALIPILQTRMQGERVSIYNESAQKDRPMSGILLKNTSPLTLEGGSLTVIEGDAYAGETLMERLKPGEERFISFALDLGTLITARSKADREPAFFVRILDGVLQAHYYKTTSKIYTITNQTDKPRTVFVEHPILEKWTLSKDTPRPVEKTAAHYRFRLEVAPRSTVELPVTEQQTLMDTYALTDMNTNYLETFVSRKYIDDATRTALEKIIEIKSKIAAVGNRLAAANTETAEISADQARLRENIKALKDTAETKQLIARYVAKANEQETRLEAITKEKRAALDEGKKLQEEFNAAIRALNLNRQLGDS